MKIKQKITTTVNMNGGVMHADFFRVCHSLLKPNLLLSNRNTKTKTQRTSTYTYWTTIKKKIMCICVFHNQIYCTKKPKMHNVKCLIFALFSYKFLIFCDNSLHRLLDNSFDEFFLSVNSFCFNDLLIKRKLQFFHQTK